MPLSEKDGGECASSRRPRTRTRASIRSPRFLYVYVNKPPGKPLDPMTQEFLKLVLSKEGQETVVKDGYFPLPASVLEKDLKRYS